MERAVMNVDRRNELIDAYFRSVDEHDVSFVEPHLAEEFTFRSLGVQELHGVDGMRTYFDELRPVAGTFHDVENRMHSENGSAVEGHLTGTHEGNDLDTLFCDVFEFDEDDEYLTRITVYTNS